MGTNCSVCSGEREADFPMEYPEHGPGKTVGELYPVLEPGGTGHMFGFKRNSDKLSDTIVPLGKSAPVMFSGSDLLIEQE